MQLRDVVIVFLKLSLSTDRLCSALQIINITLCEAGADPRLGESPLNDDSVDADMKKLIQQKFNFASCSQL